MMATKHGEPLMDAQASSRSALPPRFAHVAAAVEASRAMLDLPDDWDGEGSPAYDEATWHRAVDFLTRNIVGFWEEYGVVPEAPKVRKGPLGSIDLHWRTANRELLINIPVAASEPIDFYGDDREGGHQVKGTLDPAETNLWLLRWLTA